MQGLASKSGSWFEVLGERAGQGKEAAKRYLEEHPEICEIVVNKIYGNLGIKR